MGVLKPRPIRDDTTTLDFLYFLYCCGSKKRLVIIIWFLFRTCHACSLNAQSCRFKVVLKIEGSYNRNLLQFTPIFVQWTKVLNPSCHVMGYSLYPEVRKIMNNVKDDGNETTRGSKRSKQSRRDGSTAKRVKMEEDDSPHRHILPSHLLAMQSSFYLTTSQVSWF